jgi:hypothetical protein
MAILLSVVWVEWKSTSTRITVGRIFVRRPKRHAHAVLGWRACRRVGRSPPKKPELEAPAAQSHESESHGRYPKPY